MRTNLHSRLMTYSELETWWLMTCSTAWLSHKKCILLSLKRYFLNYCYQDWEALQCTWLMIAKVRPHWKWKERKVNSPGQPSCIGDSDVMVWRVSPYLNPGNVDTEGHPVAIVSSIPEIPPMESSSIPKYTSWMQGPQFCYEPVVCPALPTGHGRWLGS